jgi:hypothetical protein
MPKPREEVKSDPQYKILKINTTGTAVSLGNGDSGYAGDSLSPFIIPPPTSFYVSADGYISFDPNDQEPQNQCPLPDSNAPNNVIAFLAITPEDLTIRGCNGQTQKNTFTLKNYTGGPGNTYNLSYDVTTGNGSLTGPATVDAQPTQDFVVTLPPPAPACPPVKRYPPR